MLFKDYTQPNQTKTTADAMKYTSHTTEPFQILTVKWNINMSGSADIQLTSAMKIRNFPCDAVHAATNGQIYICVLLHIVLYTYIYVLVYTYTRK